MKPVLVTGTDTGVGKTVVTCSLLRCLRARGLEPFPLKLVETGCDELDQPTDGMALARAAHRLHQLSLVAPFRFRLPASPLTAARAEGRSLHPDELLQRVREASLHGAPLVIEGAGGLLVPITPAFHYADLALALDAALVVVARDALGTLNHTLLTLEAAHARGLTVLAVVLDPPAVPDPVPLDHARELRALRPETPILGPLPRAEHPHHPALDAWMAASTLPALVADHTLLA